jgi:hypothetical protein
MVMEIAVTSPGVDTNDSSIRDASRLALSVEPLIYNFCKKKKWSNDTEIEFVLTKCSVERDIGKYFSLLYNRLRHRNKRDVDVVLNYILINSKMFGQHMEPFDHELTKSIKATAQKDVVWYLWYILFVYLQCHVKYKYTDYFDLAMSCFSKAFYLFKFKYQIKTKIQRLNLLLHMYNMCCEDYTKLRNEVPRDQVISKAVEKIDTLFFDVLGTAIIKPERKQRIVKAESGTRTAKDMSYLFTYI